ncbi:hypothetical protein GF367_02255 [Candidatus Woesearchaeota archaeon]|nr:hypothetical protein [Candidatus Woesearchaeota archaeon]
MAKRIQTHILEKVIGTLMVIFGIAAVWIFFSAIDQNLLDGQMAMIEILLIVILAILAQTVILIRIYEQNLELRDKKK